VVENMVGENIDRATSIELRSYGVVPGLYKAARELAQAPLSMTAAKLMQTRLREGGHALILTGFPIMPYQLPETDGPVGAAAIARSLNLAFGVVPVILAEDEYLPCIRDTCRAAGLLVFDRPEDARGKHVAIVQGFTKRREEARRAAEELVARLQPKLGIAVERTGWNQHREHHSGRGVLLSPLTAKLDHVFEVLRERGIPTVGVGDLGNELGMGAFRKTVEAITASGAKCECPCGGGMAAVVPSDVAVVAGVSNWGAYGICAALAYLEEQDDILHSPVLEEDMLRACASGGAIDGPTGRPIPWADGIETQYHARLIAQLHDIINYPSRLCGPYKAGYEWSGRLHARASG
jgi:hypothetical protein